MTGSLIIRSGSGTSALGLNVIGGMSALHDKLGAQMLAVAAPAGAKEGNLLFIVAMSLLGLVGIVAQPHVMTSTGSGKTETEARVGMCYGNFIKRLLTIAWAFTGLIAIVVFPDARTMSFSDEIAAFSLKNRIPAISGWTHFPEHGNLMSYGPQFENSFRHLATYVDKIFKGAKPANLPVELPTKFELIVNGKTAKALGIKIPDSIMLRADKVIE